MEFEGRGGVREGRGGVCDRDSSRRSAISSPIADIIILEVGSSSLAMKSAIIVMTCARGAEERALQPQPYAHISSARR